MILSKFLLSFIFISKHTCLRTMNGTISSFYQKNTVIKTTKNTIKHDSNKINSFLGTLKNTTLSDSTTEIIVKITSPYNMKTTLT